MAIPANLGFPRIGLKRELKKATEGYWAGRVTAEELKQTASRLRAEQWTLQRDAGIEHIPSNVHSLYDHVLDTTALLGAVPDRYGWDGETVDLDTYFAMARGAQREGLDVVAMDMTKWFDTNYHYIVPELAGISSFRLSTRKPFDEFQEALELGIRTRPVLLGPLTYVLLARPEEGWDPLTALDGIVEVYTRVLAELADLGAEWVQIDEPCLVADREPAEIAALERVYGALSEAAADRLQLLVQTYFGSVGEAYPTLTGLPVAGIGLDFVRGPENLEAIARHGFPADKHLAAGVIDGRNVWAADLEAALDTLDRIGEVVPADRLIVNPSCSVMHVPILAARETGLDEELRSWLSFATEKLAETVLLCRAVNEGREAVEAEIEANRSLLAGRSRSERTRNPTVRERVAGLDGGRMGRQAGFDERRQAQHAGLDLPSLPTTLIGSFPQHAEVRAQRRRFTSGDISRAEYDAFLESEVRKAIDLQEEIGIDVVVHGEFERNDMVEYFGERMDGYAFTRHGWVQSYGSRYVKPPLLFGDVQRPEPITVRWWKFAQDCTRRPVKGMLTGPVTMLQWSFVRDDQPRSETCLQLALAIADEVQDLEAAGARVIQVDEPALREGLPLRRTDWDGYLGWAVRAFRAATGGVAPGTQIHTHMCYSEFNDIIAHIADMDADVLLIENARSDEALLEVFRAFDYERDIGPGVYDIHSPRVPPPGEMADRIRASMNVLPAERLWVNPDCGLKTRGYEEVVAALENMVQAAREVRETSAPQAAGARP